MTGNVNSQWGLAKRNQQRGNPERSQQPRQQQTQQRRANDHGGFDSLLVGHDCLTELGNGKVIRGVIAAASKYFYLINVNGQIIVVNKAWVVSIMPVQSQNKKDDVGTLVGASAGMGGNYERREQ